VKILSDNDVAEGYVRALRSTEGITVDRVVDRFGERVPDSELIAYAEEHDRVVFTGDAFSTTGPARRRRPESTPTVA